MGYPIAGLAVENARGAGLQRHAKRSELGLVPLELPLEGVVFLGIVGVVLVAGHGCGDLRRGEVTACGEQTYHQIDQAFGTAARHNVTLAALGPEAETGNRPPKVNAVTHEQRATTQSATTVHTTRRRARRPVT